VEAIRLAALIAFIAIAGLVAYAVLRTREVGRESRESQALRTTAASLAGRVDATLAAVLASVDEVRRHRMPPADALPEVGAAITAVDGYAEEVGNLQVPATAVGIRDNLVADLGRAERALDRIQHGCRQLVGASRRIGDTDEQATVRRGYLELQHAREAFATHVSELAGPAPQGKDPGAGAP
jgi:hypothetical protein